MLYKYENIYIKVKKILLEKEKMLVTRIVFPFPSMFSKGFFPQGH